MGQVGPQVASTGVDLELVGCQRVMWCHLAFWDSQTVTGASPYDFQDLCKKTWRRTRSPMELSGSTLPTTPTRRWR